MRKYTNKLIDALENGVISAEELAIDCLSWMSEDDVKAMFEADEYDVLLGDDEEED